MAGAGSEMAGAGSEMAGAGLEMAGAGLVMAFSTNALALPARQNAKRIAHSRGRHDTTARPTSVPAITLH